METDAGHRSFQVLGNYFSKLLFIASLNFLGLGSLLFGNLCTAQISGQWCVYIQGLGGDTEVFAPPEGKAR